MFISKIEITNYRNFKETEIKFNEGINVIIGHNNAGKTNLLKALSLIFNSETSKRLECDDFNKFIDVNNYFLEGESGKLPEPPKIIISVTLSQSFHAENENTDDLVIVSKWLVDVSEPYQAKLTYEFSLPEGNTRDEYEKQIEKLKKKGSADFDGYWKMMKSKFIRKYSPKIYVGNPKHKNKVDSEELSRFDFQFLDAIRDVERQMFSGKNSLLREVLNYFLDEELRKDEERREELEELDDIFHTQSKDLIDSVKARIKTEKILKYAEDTGAVLGGKPDFEGEMSATELLVALRLIISKEIGIQIPAINNGLGYNNLIFMSILLAKIQMNCSDWHGIDNAKIFPMLVIEEPEAHLHPSMQYKFLKFLKQNLKEYKQVRQIFITTHSTQIAAAVDLDEIICLNSTKDNNVHLGYPSKVFNLADEKDVDSEGYIKRFLDATKSDMLFAKSIILVEGLAEQLLINTLAKYLNKDLADYHIAVVSVGGNYFRHFLKLFDYGLSDEFKKNAMDKKISCIIDADPQRKERVEKAHWKSCFPFNIGCENEKYEYRALSSILTDTLNDFNESEAINICAVTSGKGKTFEFELIFNNPNCSLLLVPEMAKHDQIVNLMEAYREGKSLEEMQTICSEFDFINASEIWDENEKKKALIAARYYKSVKNSKGSFALEIENNLQRNLELPEDKRISFIVPQYIQNAINFVCE